MAKVSFSNPPAGKGALLKWQGTSSGAGAIRMTDSRPGKLVAIRLRMERPTRDVSEGTLEFKPTAGGTQVIWTMGIPTDYVGRLGALFGQAHKAIVTDMENGLANLKKIVEQG